MVAYMRGQPSGRYGVSVVGEALGLTDPEMVRAKDSLKKVRGLLDQLLEVGVKYVVEGKGRGAKSYLVKNI